MELSINGEARKTNFATLKELASAEFGNVKGIAIAVNDKIIPNSKWPEFSLTENDKILVVTAACGG